MKAKRTCALLLVWLMMVLCLLPSTALAEDYYTVNLNVVIEGQGSVSSVMTVNGVEDTKSSTTTYTHSVQVPTDKMCRYHLTATSGDVYGFAGWYYEGGEQLIHSFSTLPLGQDLIVNPQAAGTEYSITYVAKFVERRYSVQITFQAEGGGLVSPTSFSATNVPAAENTTFSSTATTSGNLVFTGWYLNGQLVTTNPTLSETVNSKYIDDLIQRTYVAKFEPVKYDVTVIDGTADKSSAAEGETVQITADEPATGEEFTGWDGATGLSFTDGDANSEIASFTMPARTVTLKATYDAIPTYQVTYRVSGGTWAGGGDGDLTETVMRGQSPASVPEGMQPSYGFEGGAWDVDPSTAQITGPTTFTYSFSAIPTFTVTVTSSGHGTASASVTSGTPGTEVTLTAIPDEGYRFKEWQIVSGGVTISDNTFTIGRANTEVKAIFEVIPAPVAPVYTVTGGANGSWTKGSSSSYVITIERSEDDASCFSHYVGTQIDGNPVVVTAKSGSTVVTISPEELESLSVGTHTVTVQFDDGEAETPLTIDPAPTKPPLVPSTGDGSHLALWNMLALASFATMSAAVFFGKKRTE